MKLVFGFFWAFAAEHLAMVGLDLEILSVKKKFLIGFSRGALPALAPLF